MSGFRRPAVGFVLACVFLDALGIGLIIPVLPRLVGTLAQTRDLQTVWYGAIMLSYGLMQFAAAPMIGALSDRIGRRPVLLAGIGGLGLMMVVPTISSSLWAILVSRIIGGAVSSNIVVAQAYIADVTKAGERTAAFGRIGAVFGIAFVLGPALGGILGEADPRTPFLFASILCLINFLYGVFVLPESHQTTLGQSCSLTDLNPFRTLRVLSSEKHLLAVLAIIVLFTLTQSLVQCTWALYTEFRYNWTPKTIGLSIFALGIAITLTQGLILPKLSRCLSPDSLVRGGLTIGLLSIIGIGCTASGFWAGFLLCLFALMGIVGPTLQSVISRTGSPREQGARLGAVSALNSFTGAISPLIGTPLLLSITNSEPDHPLAGLPYLLFSILLVIALLIAIHQPLPGTQTSNITSP